MARKEVIGNATLYLGNCLEILPTLPKVDAVITDPPYGIDADKRSHEAGLSGSRQLDRGSAGNKSGRGWKSYGDTDWDSKPIDGAAVGLLQAAGRDFIIWGGNYFPLPPSRCWLVWNKPERGFSLADAELAWTNKDACVRVFDGHRHDPSRSHPTQKPIALMRWCVAKTEGTVLDPFMGSGTTGVACMELERPFIGIEVHEPYFDIACERIENAQRQVRMFV